MNEETPVIIYISYVGATKILPGKQEYLGCEFNIRLSSKILGHLSIKMSYNLSVNQHLEFLQTKYENTVFKLGKDGDKPSVPPGINTEQSGDVDIKAMSSTGKSIWDNVFKKPTPVPDRKQWCYSKKSDSFVYLPNCTKYSLNDAEDFNSNTLYTEIMLFAYQQMCETLNISPCIRKANGIELKIMALKLADSLQVTETAERAAGFVGSTLIDFDDTMYAKQFVQSIQNLVNVRNEPARQTVLCKVEFILAGKSSHIFNQRFIQHVFRLMTEDMSSLMLGVFGQRTSDVISRVADILTTMVDAGFVLQKSRVEFQSRLEAGGIHVDGISTLVEIFKRGEVGDQ